MTKPNKHGGARPNSGRTRLDPQGLPMKTVSVCLPEQLVAWLDNEAARWGVSRSDALRRILLRR